MIPGPSDNWENLFLCSMKVWRGRERGRGKEGKGGGGERRTERQRQREGGKRGVETAEGKGFSDKKQNTGSNFFLRIYNELVNESSASKSKLTSLILESSSISLKQNCEIGFVC